MSDDEFTLKQKYLLEKWKSNLFKQFVEQLCDIRINDSFEFIKGQNLSPRHVTVVEPKKSEKKSEAKSKSITKTHIDVDKKYDELITEFEQAQTTRKQNTILSTIKKKHNNLIKTTPLNEYTQLLIDHITFLRKKFESIDSKKIDAYITKTLSAIDYRLLFYTGFEKQTFDGDDIELLTCNLEYTSINNGLYFDERHLLDYLQNYNIVAFSLEKILTTYFIQNKDKICCLDNDFAFYTLKNKNSWCIDHRLETLTLFLFNNLQTYCLDLFRKIYKKCFGTNNYVNNFCDKYPIMDIDIQNLLKNYFITANCTKLNILIRKIVKENCKYVENPLDKFDTKKDKITDINKDGDDEQTYVHALFDKIDDEKIKYILNKYN